MADKVSEAGSINSGGKGSSGAGNTGTTKNVQGSGSTSGVKRGTDGVKASAVSNEPGTSTKDRVTLSPEAKEAYGSGDPLADRYGKKIVKDAVTKPFFELGKAAAEKMDNPGMKWSVKGIEGVLSGSKALGGDMKDALKLSGKTLGKFAGPAGLAYDILGNPGTANGGEAQSIAKWFTDRGKEVPQNVKDWVNREGGN